MVMKEPNEEETPEYKKYMDDLNRAIRESMQVFLEPTKKLIALVERDHTFTVASKYKSFNGVQLELSRSTEGYRYSYSEMVMHPEEVKVNQGAYWLFEEHEWVNAALRIKLSNAGIAKQTVTYGNKVGYKGPVREFSLSYPFQELAYRRFVIRVPKNPSNYHYKALDSIRFATGGTLHYAGMCLFECQGVGMRLFNYDDDAFASSLVIDSGQGLDHAHFQQIVNAAMTVLGAVTGDLHRTEHYVVASRDRDHLQPVGLIYNQGRESVLTETAWLDGHLWLDVIKEDRHLAYLPMGVFSVMVSKAFSDLRYARALRVISESNAYPMEIRASGYAVALETMKNIISDERPEAFNPFRTKKAAKDFRKACFEELTKLPDEVFNNRAAVMKRIDQLNQPTNTDALETSFRVAGVRLNEHDKRTISMRNDFLHGRLPFEGEEPNENGDTLSMVTYKLQFLLSALVLRYAGYRGGIRNNYMYVGTKAGRDTGDDALFR